MNKFSVVIFAILIIEAYSHSLTVNRERREANEPLTKTSEAIKKAIEALKSAQQSIRKKRDTLGELETPAISPDDLTLRNHEKRDDNEGGQGNPGLLDGSASILRFFDNLIKGLTNFLEPLSSILEASVGTEPEEH